MRKRRKKKQLPDYIQKIKDEWEGCTGTMAIKSSKGNINAVSKENITGRQK